MTKHPNQPWRRNSEFPSAAKPVPIGKLKRAIRRGKGLAVLVSPEGARFRLPAICFRQLRESVFRAVFIQHLFLFLLAVAGGAALLISAQVRAAGHTPGQWAAYGVMYLVIALWFLGKALQPLRVRGRRVLLQQARFAAWVRYCGDKRATLTLVGLLLFAWILQVLVDGTASPTVEAPSVATLGLERTAILSGELWRMPAAALLHGGLIHLIVNVFTLYVFGAWCETVLGRHYFLLSLLVGLVSGAVGSLVFYSGVPTIGFSGALGGMIGLLLTVTLFTRNVFPGGSGVQLFLFALIWFAFGRIETGVDEAMHASGFTAGLVVGGALLWSRHPELQFRRWFDTETANATGVR